MAEVRAGEPICSSKLNEVISVPRIPPENPEYEEPKPETKLCICCAKRWTDAKDPVLCQTCVGAGCDPDRHVPCRAEPSYE